MTGADEADRIRRLRETARERWGDTDGDVAALAALLDSDDADERAEAAWALAELAADADRSRRFPVESRLVALLDDEDPWVRRGASWALATVADERPGRARAAGAELTGGLTDDDPLVRENSVLALASVGAEYPRAVEPALSRLAALARDGDGLAARYAAETFRRLLVRLDETGFPETVEATPEFADLLPEGAGVVDVTDDPGNGGDAGVRVRSESEDSSTDETDPAARAAREDPEADGPPDRIPPHPGTDADRRAFERLADLGEGPLTTAVKARAPGDGGQQVVVALRTLRSDAEVDPASVERAFRAWAGVDDHDHVAPVLARGSSPRPWVATEFMDGGTLRGVLGSGGSVGFERALWYAHCVTTAVCHAHARGVVHGALRPGAVGLSQSLGSWSVPKVGDWGLGGPLSAVRSPPVPPGFAAPEHLAPEEFGRPDPATDVYQLGALSYALFAGRPPFVGDAREVGRKVRREDPEPAAALAPDVPEEVGDLLGRALTKEKPARFETAEDFRRELEVVVREYGPDDW
ncbi:HEAT repeat domain-containing protein (plasmid) [Halorussus salilacus]|uniref:protein kinase domain-containing protein n=1 Tax=Halorussus salilacus TaxID=2953750 RepID=UPI00209F3C26|nr:HEAT repeat domain-containing protein [Halorussus salilacus]USZ69883.1 HEAT repeat domain-containing protein [Halorussus salilacus]